jgi:hypothetical protein
MVFAFFWFSLYNTERVSSVYIPVMIPIYNIYVTIIITPFHIRTDRDDEIYKSEQCTCSLRETCIEKKPGRTA